MVTKAALFSVLCLVGFPGLVPVFAQDTLPTPAVQLEDVALDPIAAWKADPTLIFDAGDVDLGAFQWIARPVIVFAESPNDPAFIEQLDLLGERPDDLVERDVVVITDTDPGTLSDIRRRLRPRGFQLVLIGKDGDINLRKPFPWHVREITRIIDKMPMRQREIRDGG